VGPVTSNCTFPLAFTVTNYTVKLTQITPSGTSNPAVNTAVSVASNGSVPYTLTPPAGVNHASFGYSTACGSITQTSWVLGSTQSLRVGPVTGACAFSVAYTKK
jgi:hypothetical protein